MTDNQKKLWEMLPIGKWVVRDEMHEQYGKWNFQRALSMLYDRKLIQLEFRDGVQYMRKKTIEELTNTPPTITQ